ncbi:LysR family transcriptional regulator [Pseudooceanicola sp. HF7]|uniref:LysR family transcriptional regulator n=1 Tax=Pseudooceanicola sp. HF7 TaxID=2721560 RepID=UPI001430DBAC|nr:LysR family transcriptional regulator [Pseudooceanicola sp. HF7]NIZ10022.1 LysR family transcriptional regulator [Pseudooceanicola sp. HF7]
MVRYTLRQLEYFVAVGEAGSITLAAARVNVSSPSISAAISQLETEFGLPLFVRQHAQGLSLTQAGRRLIAQARTVLREADRLVDLAGDISGQVRGPLDIGCMVTFAQVVLPALRRDFVTAFPEVRLTQAELDATGIVAALRRAEIDVALTYDLLMPPDLRFVPLIDLPPFVMLPPDHRLATREAVSVRDLAEEPMILLDLPHSNDYFLSFFQEAGLRPQIAERSRDLAVVRSLVANGFGYSLANMRPVTGAAPDGRPLRILPLEGDLRPMRMGLMTTPQAETTSVVRSFVDFARDWIQEDFRNGRVARATAGPQAAPALDRDAPPQAPKA